VVRVFAANMARWACVIDDRFFGAPAGDDTAGGFTAAAAARAAGAGAGEGAGAGSVVADVGVGAAASVAVAGPLALAAALALAFDTSACWACEAAFFFLRFFFFFFLPGVAAELPPSGVAVAL